MKDSKKASDERQTDRLESTAAPGAEPSTFDPENLRLSQNFGAALGVKKHLTTVPVRKPGPQDFFRVHPDPTYRLETKVLELKEEGETYLVSPDLWPDLEGEVIAKVLYVTINRQGVLRLWPIRLPDEEGKLDDWNRSAHEAVDVAKAGWIRLKSNRSLGAYEIFEAQGQMPEPEWPDLDLQKILQVAFKDRFIREWAHPALRRLRGEG